MTLHYRTNTTLLYRTNAIFHLSTNVTFCQPEVQVSKFSLSIDALAVFVQAISHHLASLSPEQQAEFKAVQALALAVHPPLHGVAVDLDPVAAADAKAVKEDIDREANTIFQNIYNGQQSVEEAIQVCTLYPKNFRHLSEHVQWAAERGGGHSGM